MTPPAPLCEGRFKGVTNIFRTLLAYSALSTYICRVLRHYEPIPLQATL